MINPRELLIDNRMYHLLSKSHKETMAEQTAAYYERDGYQTAVVPHDGGWRIYTRPKVHPLN